MKKYILPSLSILTLLILLVQGLWDLQSIETISVPDRTDLIKGKFVESFRKEFDQKVPLRDEAISFWSILKFFLFKEGSKGVLIGSENWLFTSEEYEKTFIDDFSRDEFFHKIEGVNQYFDEKGISLLVAVIPSKSRVYQENCTRYPYSEELQSRYNQSIQRLKNAGIRTADLKKAFKAQKESQQLFYKSDTHWTFGGAMVSAEEIQKEVEPLIKNYGLSKRSYILNKGEEIPFEGDLIAYLPPLEGITETYREIDVIDTSPPVLGLFDSVEIPVILVGTSYSADSRWNFEDAMKISLQLDVLNLAEEGKGPFPPMLNLMESEYFYEINSKMIIWEIPERYIPLY